VTRQTIDPEQFWSNFSLQSNIFRHSLRLTIAAMAAYFVGKILPLGHGYWVLLTVIIILKPGYSLSKQRNVQRIVGTLIGVAIGWVILYFVKNNTAIFIFLIITMTAGYSFIRWKYTVGVVFITLFLLFMFQIQEPADFNDVIEERVVDTLLGCAIGFLASLVLPPIWERQRIGDLMQKVVIDIADYFENVAWVFIGKPYNREMSKENRKHAWVSLANLSDAFTQMLSEPKSKRRDSREFHRFVVSSHMLVSHLATLSYYADTLKKEYIMEDYRPLIEASLAELKAAGRILDNPAYNIPSRSADNPQALLDKKVNALMQTRQQELQQGKMESENKRYLSNFKSITDQFYFVYKTAQDLLKISKKLSLAGL
ncbi:MAG TPA: FUSC family protein, partial [Chitinophagaceae bacterium]|nr:FUSC family protein [Chitinophagaceae bacterium]